MARYYAKEAEHSSLMSHIIATADSKLISSEVNEFFNNCQTFSFHMFFVCFVVFYVVRFHTYSFILF